MSEVNLPRRFSSSSGLKMALRESDTERMISPMNAIPLPVQNVLDLFSSDLADVRFGDVDAQALSNATAAVQAAAAEVAIAETSFADARSKLQEQQDALLQQVHRALAYARVYAEADAELSARLEAITLPRAPRRARTDASPSVPPSGRGTGTRTSDEAQMERRPRGRPRKSPTPAAEPLLESVAASAE
jgi:hypothetical protein